MDILKNLEEETRKRRSMKRTPREDPFGKRGEKIHSVYPFRTLPINPMLKLIYTAAAFFLHYNQSVTSTNTMIIVIVRPKSCSQRDSEPPVLYRLFLIYPRSIFDLIKATFPSCIHGNPLLRCPSTFYLSVGVYLFFSSAFLGLHLVLCGDSSSSMTRSRHLSHPYFSKQGIHTIEQRNFHLLHSQRRITAWKFHSQVLKYARDICILPAISFSMKWELAESYANYDCYCHYNDSFCFVFLVGALKGIECEKGLFPMEPCGVYTCVQSRLFFAPSSRHSWHHRVYTNRNIYESINSWPFASISLLY